MYYPVRHALIQHIVSSIQRLGFTATATIEQKRLAVDLCEIVIKWEMQRVKEEEGASPSGTPAAGSPAAPVVVGVKRPSSDALASDSKRKAGAGGATGRHRNFDCKMHMVVS